MKPLILHFVNMQLWRAGRHFGKILKHLAIIFGAPEFFTYTPFPVYHPVQFVFSSLIFQNEKSTWVSIFEDQIHCKSVKNPYYKVQK